MTLSRRAASAAAVLAFLAAACKPSQKSVDDERALWQALARTFAKCILTSSTAQCRAQIEAEEWSPISAATATGQELHGVIAPGGSKYASPTTAPEGDFCVSHDDLDWNFNVTPDAAYASLLQAGNAAADVDHPAGVIEGEWESFFLDPAYVAKPAGASANFRDWGKPNVDMAVGDRVAERGAGVLDRGHSPYRSEIHPPWLLLWGGRRFNALVIHARASALLTRPSEFRPLANPPDASEALTERFPLPSEPNCNPGPATLQLVPQIEYFYDDPAIVVDQGCDLTNGVSLQDLDGPAFDTALASPAAHLVGTNTTSAAASFFSLAVSSSSGAAVVTLTPLARPHQALFGAKITASWICP